MFRSVIPQILRLAFNLFCVFFTPSRSLSAQFESRASPAGQFSVGLWSFVRVLHLSVLPAFLRVTCRLYWCSQQILSFMSIDEYQGTRLPGYRYWFLEVR
jgi:hypothetical protein